MANPFNKRAPCMLLLLCLLGGPVCSTTAFLTSLGQRGVLKVGLGHNEYGYSQRQRLLLSTMASSFNVPEKLSVGILIFENVEVLDFTGPFEVFSRTRLEAGTAARRTEDSAPFRVFTVAANEGTIAATGNLRVVADYSFASAPKIDVLVVPGGFGTRPLLQDETTIQWIKTVASSAKLVTSVCTGALLLAKAGLLKGRSATSHWASLDTLQEQDDDIRVERTLRWVEDGDVISSAGVAAGIDMAFHVVERLCGKAVADETAYYIEYPRRLATDPRSTTVAVPK